MSTRSVAVAVPRPLRRTFDYAVPADVRYPSRGCRVAVPFSGASVVGIVTGPGTTDRTDLKPIHALLDAVPLLPDDLLALADWLSSYYHHPLGEVFATMLPRAARRPLPLPIIETRIWHAISGDTSVLARAPRQRETFERLATGPIADTALAAAGIERRHLNALAERGLARAEVAPPPYATSPSPLQLTPEQASAVTRIDARLGDFGVFLLDGVTGSGKTEVYLQVIERVLARGQQALVLVPEIALTPQTVARFQHRFGAAGTLHSQVPDAERADTWRKCADGTHRIVIGTRSAVFCPFRDLGVIIVDEEHDTSFKQSDGLRYSARDVAVKRGQLANACVVLGSATPSLESLANGARSRYETLLLPRRAGGASLPTYRVVDIRGRRLHAGLGEEMLAAIGVHLANQHQALVFINRRGFAPTVLCGACGSTLDCPNCDARLTLHHATRPSDATEEADDLPPGSSLRCHHCDAISRPPKRCHGCDADQFVVLGAGTQRAEAELSSRFAVPVFRIDRDSTRTRRELERTLDAVASGQPCVLVGTQMLAKGHHLPNVTLVAVVDADAGFLSVDFRAPERTAQLMTQVAGRAGRERLPGEVLVQTFQEDNVYLRALIDGDYASFAQAQLATRREAALPPFTALAIIRAESRIGRLAEQFLATLVHDHAQLARTNGVTLAGPVEAPMHRRADRYRYQCLVRATTRAAVHRVLDAVTATSNLDRQVRWSIDVDPYDLF